jgi:hypothetical protein
LSRSVFIIFFVASLLYTIVYNNEVRSFRIYFKKIKSMIKWRYKNSIRLIGGPNPKPEKTPQSPSRFVTLFIGNLLELLV